MSVSVNHGNNLRHQFLDKHLATTFLGGTDFLTERQKSNAKKWVTRWRRNWDLFAEEVLQIKLYPLQKMSIHMMGVAQTYDEISTRGAAKSFRVAVASLCELCLYPYSEIVITASTIPQAAKLAEKKIRDEIIKKLSPYLLYMLEHEYIVITKSSVSDGGAITIENKLNGSTIKVMPCLESSRGERSTTNIYEENRLLKKSIVDSVFEPMGHARQAKFLTNNPKYNIPRWQQESRSIHISSARYKYEWFSKKFDSVVSNYYTSKHEKYIPFAQDIFTAIEDGSRTWADYRRLKKSMSDIDFRMEILNEMYSENEDGYFNLEEFKSNQVLEHGFVPPKISDIFAGNDISMREKAANEIRLIITDLAFSGNNSKEKNDATVMMCMSLNWKDFRFERHIDYVETRPGGGADKLVLRIKELFHDYQSDYLVMDNRSGGETIYDYLSMITEHPQRGTQWNPSGFTVANELDYQVASDGKIQELRNRTVDPNAIPCIIPILATSEFNSNCWRSLKKQLGVNNIKFLIPSSERQEVMEYTGEYYELTSEEFADAMLPYMQTEALIQECVNLSAEYRNGLIKLTEPRSGWKDRAVVLAYGNLIADKIENKYNRLYQKQDIDLEEIELVF